MSLDGRKYRGIVAWRASHQARVTASTQAALDRQEKAAKAARKQRKQQVAEQVALRDKQVQAEQARKASAKPPHRKRLHKVRI